MAVGYARRWVGLGALALGMLAIGFDITILNVAPTTPSEDLDASTGELQWIVDSYLLVFAAVLLPAGLLGDRLGRKRLLLLGLGLFGAAALAAAVLLWLFMPRRPAAGADPRPGTRESDHEHAVP